MADEEKVPNEQPSTEQPEREPLKVSRRDFLVGTGVGVIATGAVAGGYIALRPAERVEVVQQVEAVPKEGAPAEVASAGLPATMRAVTLNIDGKTHDVVVDVRESLWETMVNQLGLRSVNLGCDRAQCGACTVTVDGRAVNGCTVLSARLGRGQEILTVDGLSKGTTMEDLHPIQRAYWQEGGYQCGICTRGFIMSTYDLLSRNVNPTEDDIREALGGNICRCSEYPKIFAAVFKAAEDMRAGA